MALCASRSGAETLLAQNRGDWISMLLARWAIALPGWRFYGGDFRVEVGDAGLSGQTPSAPGRRVFYKGRRYARSRQFSDRSFRRFDVFPDLGHIPSSQQPRANRFWRRCLTSLNWRGHANDPEQKLGWMLSGGEDYELCLSSWS